MIVRQGFLHGLVLSRRRVAALLRAVLAHPGVFHLRQWSPQAAGLWLMVPVCSASVMWLAGCGGGGGTGASASDSATASAAASASSGASGSGTTSGSGSGGAVASGTSLAAAYKNAHWGSNVSVSFPSECSMTLSSDGLPNHALPAYYLTPATSGQSVVATTTDGLQLTVSSNPNTRNPIVQTFNVCPTKAAQPTSTNMGTIGVMISGAALFNAYDATGNPAEQQNVSYAFTDSSGITQTASFLDTCNGHYTPANTGGTYHYHGVSACVTSQTDTQGGPSHIIGIALDGFPVYGGRDMQGNVINVATLDACNGITSPTPEFPGGVYHYVLPEGVTGAKSSIGCYSGTVTRSQIAMAEARGICVAARTAVAITPIPRASQPVATIRRKTSLAIG